MSENVCPQCGAPIEPGAVQCKFCGEKLVQQVVNQQVYQQPQQSVQQETYVQPDPQYTPEGIDPSWPVKSKTAAGLLAIFLGGLGVHKFYLGKTGMGILYLVFCWTYIPEIVGIIEGIIYLCSSDENFQLKNHVRIQ